MSEEADVDTGLMIIEDEKMNEEKGEPEKGSPLEKQMTVMMTSEQSVEGSTPDREIQKIRAGISELDSSPLVSFQSLNSSQSSARDKMIPYVPPLGEVRILQFRTPY